MRISTPKRRARRKQPAGAEAYVDEIFRRSIDLLFISMGWGGQVEPVIQAAIPPERFKQLLFLCHPDKHGNSKIAEEVTKWLLEERKKQQQ